MLSTCWYHLQGTETRKSQVGGQTHEESERPAGKTGLQWKICRLERTK